MNLGWRVSCVFEVVGAFLRGEGRQRLADGGADVVVGARLGLAQEVFELGEDLLDRVEVGGVFGDG